MSVARWLAAFAVLLGMPAAAHLIDAQRGTLNVVGDGGFLVLSVPVSAFSRVDDDDDGLLSMAELRRHHADIEAQVVGGVLLSRDDGPPVALEGVMLTLSPEHGAREGVARHVVVMGRFALPGKLESLALEIRLFGRAESERRYVVSITRDSAGQEAHFAPGERARHRLRVE